MNSQSRSGSFGGAGVTVEDAAPLRSVPKRVLDILMSAGALVFLAPLLITVALCIRITDPGPVLFSQERIGLRGRRFRCYKFRSMVVDSQARLRAHLAANPDAAAEWERDHKLRNDPRITPIGRFLRKTSLDELPQLVNILRGDMSVVGPRPIVEAEIVKYGPSFAAYSAVRPGLTGAWQVGGRSDTSYDERVELDVDYVERWSLGRDIKIVLLTVPAVLLNRGAV
ncbi:sugar transferase [Maricaulis parjimensis]|uniref:sugar transferase n=1 Tax=Maricaulis parjimensis TaxID=144023 RepID=UPI003084143A